MLKGARRSFCAQSHEYRSPELAQLHRRCGAGQLPLASPCQAARYSSKTSCIVLSRGGLPCKLAQIECKPDVGRRAQASSTSSCWHWPLATVAVIPTTFFAHEVWISRAPSARRAGPGARWSGAERAGPTCASPRRAMICISSTHRPMSCSPDDVKQATA